MDTLYAHADSDTLVSYNFHASFLALLPNQR